MKATYEGTTLSGLNEWKNPHRSLDLSYVTPRGENELGPSIHPCFLTVDATSPVASGSLPERTGTLNHH